MVEAPQITNEPLSPEPVDLGAIRGSLSPENAQILNDLNEVASRQFDPESISDEELSEIAARIGEKYISTFTEDTIRAKRLLGVQDEDTQELDASDNVPAAKKAEENLYRRRLADGSAFSKIYYAARAEALASGLSTEEFEDASQELLDSYDGFVQPLAKDLDEKLARFTRLVRLFGTPDLLRAEGKDAGLAYVEELVGKIERSGVRPEKHNVIQRLGWVANGRRTKSQEEFDESVARRLKSFKQRPPSELLEEYVKNAILSYTKTVYGERSFIASPANESDSRDFYDSFEADRINPNHHTPLRPGRIVTDELKGYIRELLFGASKFSERLDDRLSDDKWRQSERQTRAGNFYAQFKTNTDARDTSTNGQTAHGERATASTPNSGDVYAGVVTKAEYDFSLAFSAISDREINSTFVSMIPKFRADFAERVEHAKERGIVDLVLIIHDAMTSLHPDRFPDAPEEIVQQNAELFKMYQLVRKKYAALQG